MHPKTGGMGSFLSVIVNKLLQWLVLHESLHGLIACQTQLVVERCSSTVTVLGSLPEQALIITQERTILHPLSSLRR